MRSEERACEGGRTVNVDPCGHFVECLACGSEVRWDMQDHPFWGFRSSCPELRKSAVAVDPHVGGTTE